jgi:hypothetical protein
VAKSLAEEHPILQEHLVEAAIIEEEFKLAVETAERFGLDHLLTDDVVSASGLPSETDCLTLPVPADRIFFVDSVKGLETAQKEICASDVVALDSEWKADHVRGAPPNPVALLQLATRGGAWLVDIIALGENAPSELEAFLLSVFSNPGVLKLGFAVNGDFDRLAKTHPEIRGALANGGPVLDLAALARLREIRVRSLSGICGVCIGRPLSKRARMSNWEQRPLTEAQMHYAALDALCLIPLFDLLSDPRYVAPQPAQAVENAVDTNGGVAVGEGTASVSTVQDADGSSLEDGGKNGSAEKLVQEDGSTSGQTGEILGSSQYLRAASEPVASADCPAEGTEENGASSSPGGRITTPLSETAADPSADVSEKKVQKSWQDLVYNYGASVAPEGPNKKQRRWGAKRKEKSLAVTEGLEGGLDGGKGEGLEGLEGDVGVAKERDLTVQTRGSEGLGADSGGAGVRNTEFQGFEGGSDENGRKRDLGVAVVLEPTGIWGGLGLPERVADVLHRGRMRSPQVLVWNDITDKRDDLIESGGELVGEVESGGADGVQLGGLRAVSSNQKTLHDEADTRDKDVKQQSEKGEDKPSGNDARARYAGEEMRALEEWRASKKAERNAGGLEGSAAEAGSGQVAGGEGAHVAKRPAWQVRCIPVLISGEICTWALECKLSRNGLSSAKKDRTSLGISQLLHFHLSCDQQVSRLAF